MIFKRLKSYIKFRLIFSRYSLLILKLKIISNCSSQDHKVHLDEEVRMADQDPPDLLGLQDQLDLLDNPDHQDLKDNEDHPEREAHPVDLGPEDPQEIKDHKDSPDLRDKLDLQDLKVMFEIGQTLLQI